MSGTDACRCFGRSIARRPLEAPLLRCRDRRQARAPASTKSDRRLGRTAPAICEVASGGHRASRRPPAPSAAASSVAASSTTYTRMCRPTVDLVAVAQEMLGDGGAVDERAVGAAEVFEERIVENRHDRGMLSAHRGVGQADVVVRAAPDRDALPVELDLERRAVGLEVHELAHGAPLASSSRVSSRASVAPTRRSAGTPWAP